MENEMRDALKRMGQKREIKGRKYIVDATGEVVIQPYALGAPYNLKPADDLHLDFAKKAWGGLWDFAEQMEKDAEEK